MKKTISKIILIMLMILTLASLTGCGNTCSHNYIETQVESTCKKEGYNLFTCSKCSDSYKGNLVIPVKNHTGLGKCTQCNTKFDTIWKEFISKYGENGTIGISGEIGVTLSYSDNYDCLLFAITSDDGKDQRTLTLGYNAYDQKWTWLFDFYNAFGTAYGSFSQWSSKSSSLNCEKKTGYISTVYTDSELLAEVKRLYNKTINDANSKLKELGYNMSMANFGLEN